MLITMMYLTLPIQGIYSGMQGQYQILFALPLQLCHHGMCQYFFCGSSVNIQNICSLIYGTSWLTHWGQNKMAAFFRTTFLNEFSWMEVYEFRLKFHWNLFLWI